MRICLFLFACELTCLGQFKTLIKNLHNDVIAINATESTDVLLKGFVCTSYYPSYLPTPKLIMLIIVPIMTISNTICSYIPEVVYDVIVENNTEYSFLWTMLHVIAWCNVLFFLLLSSYHLFPILTVTDSYITNA